MTRWVLEGTPTSALEETWGLEGL
eukprot:SAG31_NODE_41297_length_276_cov_2.796610_1_plen_23_part_01